MRRPSKVKMAAALLLASQTSLLLAETPVESNVDTRLSLAFSVPDAQLQSWLPDPWRPSPIPGGPAKGANLVLVLVQKLLTQTPDGKPLAVGGTERAIALAVLAKKSDADELRLFVIKSYTNDPKGLPGAYKNASLATIRRHLEVKDEGESLGTSTDTWEMKDNTGGSMHVRVAYQRSVPVRAKLEMKPFSAAEPTFYRIYRGEQGVETVKSAPNGIDRVSSYQFRVDVAELTNLFGTNPQLVSITANPWYVRQVSLP